MKRRLSTPLQCAILFAAAILSGLVDRSLRKNPLPWKQDWSNMVTASANAAGVATIPLERAAEIAKTQSHIILDARPHADFNAGHIPGAFSVPSQEMEKYLGDVLPLLTPAQPIMTYCSGHECDESVTLSRHLVQNGFTNIVLFVGGWSEWSAAKKAVEK